MPFHQQKWRYEPTMSKTGGSGSELVGKCWKLSDDCSVVVIEEAWVAYSLGQGNLDIGGLLFVQES